MTKIVTHIKLDVTLIQLLVWK